MLLTTTPLFALLTLTSAQSNLAPRQIANVTAPPCKLPTWTLTNFHWFNSSHNLNCDRRSEGRDLSAQLLCMTGLNPQPPGYGPPSVLTVDITDIGHCRQRNPGSVPPREIGNGWIRCHSSAPNLFFQGNSNTEESEATIRVTEELTCPDSGERGEGDRDEDGRLRIWSINGEAKFGLRCSHDLGRNATCTTKEPSINIPITGWALGSGRWVEEDY